MTISTDFMKISGPKDRRLLTRQEPEDRRPYNRLKIDAPGRFRRGKLKAAATSQVPAGTAALFTSLEAEMKNICGESGDFCCSMLLLPSVTEYCGCLLLLHAAAAFHCCLLAAICCCCLSDALCLCCFCSL